ncbi:pyridoxamine 5'-phosphate oxidase family protein [Halapricum sp. CBA1109]|uniref:pyridoxamine 5'-phosphate oxidase family protein n=1 Tax=Halapricum sp. CBA1109 TaxID=2668068 RepID=UPI0018D2165A|nr:pyridoxamine 5'-phosphate oxidase family protein [Halapricum sp. CBA1109]
MVTVRRRGTPVGAGRAVVAALTSSWVDFDGEHVLVNTVRDNRKDRNVRKDPRLALAIADPENPYRYLSIRGEVIERREDGARDYLDGLADATPGRVDSSGSYL